MAIANVAAWPDRSPSPSSQGDEHVEQDLLAIRRQPVVCLVATSSLFWTGSSRAGGDGRGGDHDRARQALEAGEVLPLRTILDRVEREYPGQVLEVELESDGGRWVYEIRTLRSGGSLVKLKGEARDGTVLGVKAREAGGKRAPGGRNGEEY